MAKKTKIYFKEDDLAEDNETVVSRVLWGSVLLFIIAICFFVAAVVVLWWRYQQ